MVISVILQLTGIAISRIKRPPSGISVIYTHFRVKLIILLNSACKITCICQVWLKHIKLEFSILPFFLNRAFIQNMIRKNNTGTSSESQYFNVTILFHNLEVLLLQKTYFHKIMWLCERYTVCPACITILRIKMAAILDFIHFCKF